MSIAETTDPRIAQIKITEETLTAYLTDGRSISVPLAWSWRLASATPAQRESFQIIGEGQGVHWPEIDEDISARGMLQGLPARPTPTNRPWWVGFSKDKAAEGPSGFNESSSPRQQPTWQIALALIAFD